MKLSSIQTVQETCLRKCATRYASPGYIPGKTPYTTPSSASSWFSRLKDRLGDTTSYMALKHPTISRVLGLTPPGALLNLSPNYGFYGRVKTKYGPDTPQYEDAHRDPRAWDMNVKRTNDPNMVLSLGDWGAKNQARLRNIAKYDPRYEFARLTGAREEDIINHHILNVEMPRYRVATGSKNLKANVPMTATQEKQLYDMDAKYKLKSAPLAMTQAQRDAAAQYLIARRKAQEELAAGGKLTQAFGAGADIKNPFSKEDSPELYDWLISASRR